MLRALTEVTLKMEPTWTSEALASQPRRTRL